MYKTKHQKPSSRIAKRRKIRESFALVLKIGLPIAVVVGVIFLLRADFLQIKNLAVIGTQEIPREQIKTAVVNYLSGNKFLIIPKSNIFFVNKNQLVSVLLANFTRIEKVDINKQFFDKGIEINVAERSSDFFWCDNDLSAQAGCYFMTKNGLVFEKSDNNSDKIIFTGILQDDPLMKNYATADQMQKYINFIQIFKDAGFEISSVNIESNDKATAKSNIGDIIFSPSEIDLSFSASNAILLINQTKIKSPSVKFNYIDTRFGNKMFYKLF